MVRMIASSATCRGGWKVAGRHALLIFSNPTFVLAARSARSRPGEQLLLLLRHRSLGRLKSDLAVRAIAERLGHRSAAPAEGNSRLPGRVDLVASRIVQL